MADRPPAFASQRLQLWQERIRNLPRPRPELREAGRVLEVADGIAVVTGLERALADEVLEFACGIRGLVLDLEPGRLGVALLGPTSLVQPGEAVYRTARVIRVPVGSGLLGRVLSPLGEPLDSAGPLRTLSHRPIEVPAPGVMQRAPVSRPLATGIKVVDAAIPVGLGQRQLIIGDRQTGKTSLAVDAILNQKSSDLLCIYCAIGQRGDAVARVIAALDAGQMRERTLVIYAGDEQVPGLAYLAPYAAMSMAEHFALQGRDVLLVLDDLTHHAQAYRELSLLLRRPPGREAFPGDIFYVHARLLERAGQFSGTLGGGSITALPVVETQAENLSAYIPTNLISITDGQVYLSPRLVRRNQFPAVDLGLSVSRVGGKAQNRALRAVAGNLRVTLSQFAELEDFARFGTRLDDSTRARLRRGAAVRAALRQAERDPMPVLQQLAVLYGAMAGLLDDFADDQMLTAMSQLRKAVEKELAALHASLQDGLPLDDQQQQQLLDCAAVALGAQQP